MAIHPIVDIVLKNHKCELHGGAGGKVGGITKSLWLHPLGNKNESVQDFTEIRLIAVEIFQ